MYLGLIISRSRTNKNKLEVREVGVGRKGKKSGRRDEKRRERERQEGKRLAEVRCEAKELGGCYCEKSQDEKEGRKAAVFQIYKKRIPIFP